MPIEASRLNRLIVDMVSLGKDFETRFLDEALRSGEFLEHDGRSDNFMIGPLLQHVIDLGEALDGLSKYQLAVEKRHSLFDEYLKNGSASESVTIRNADLVLLGGLHAKAELVVRSLVSVIRLWDGKPGIGAAATIRLGEVVDLPKKGRPYSRGDRALGDDVPLLESLPLALRGRGRSLAHIRARAIRLFQHFDPAKQRSCRNVQPAQALRVAVREGTRRARRPRAARAAGALPDDRIEHFPR
jgi:hypothetical protein